MRKKDKSIEMLQTGKIPLFVTVSVIVPFVMLSIAISTGYFGDLDTVSTVLVMYSAVIISFMGGVHWGIAVQQYSKNFRIANMLILESILPVLLSWALVFVPSVHIQILMLTLLFTFIWAIDSLLYNLSIIPQWFFIIRCMITPLVLGALYIAYFGIV